MDLTQKTVEALLRDYFLWLGIFVLILVFALYVYLFPKSIDFFDNPTIVRSEPLAKNRSTS